ncbi:MAG: AAA family ATPase, partial [Magnetovibrio sp.]|nr:AAA family ATPase [Magnetovibrio sp.]
MRIRHLDLIRYGKFTEEPIAFPKPVDAEKPDFHLIVGANEAGKSTTRHAITDLLFGIDPRTRFDFIHDKKDLCLGGILETETNQLEYHRLRRNKQPLRSPDGTELPDDALAPFTGNADRLSFLREFCLDHAGLKVGGENLMKSGDDVGRMLFEASAGVGIFGDFLDRLEEEAASLWIKGRSRSHEFYQVHDAFNEAKKKLREATAKTTEWKSVNQTVAQASEALATALNNYAMLEKTRTRLERIRRVAPHLQTRNLKIEECA